MIILKLDLYLLTCRYRLTSALATGFHSCSSKLQLQFQDLRPESSRKPRKLGRPMCEASFSGIRWSAATDFQVVLMPFTHSNATVKNFDDLVSWDKTIYIFKAWPKPEPEPRLLKPSSTSIFCNMFSSLCIYCMTTDQLFKWDFMTENPSWSSGEPGCFIIKRPWVLFQAPLFP